MAEFPLGFIFFFDDMECSQALQYCHDQVFDIYDFYQHGVNVIGFDTFGGFENCSSWCADHQFRYIAYQISLMCM